MNARDKILSRLKAARSRAQAQPIQPLTAHLAAHPRGPRPPPQSDLLKCFKERAAKLSSDVLEASHIREVPELVAGYLRERQLPMQGTCWTSLAGLPWVEAGLEMQARIATNHDLVGVTGTFCGIAETGTLMLLSGPATPASTSLLPETHVAVIDPRRIVATMEDGWDLLRQECDHLPRAINFVSGPSRTADIEQTVTLGAHGPYRVLLILVPEPRTDT
jgi:L-lactate dehydrogenase complex protein LldG